jgi:hypothetical protein
VSVGVADGILVGDGKGMVGTGVWMGVATSVIVADCTLVEDGGGAVVDGVGDKVRTGSTVCVDVIPAARVDVDIAVCVLAVATSPVALATITSSVKTGVVNACSTRSPILPLISRNITPDSAARTTHAPIPREM